MRNFPKKLLAGFIAATFLLPALAGCSLTKKKNDHVSVDYVSQLHLDLTSTTKKLEVTVLRYIDGDTTHFDPVTNSTITHYDPSEFSATTENYIKARYLAVNTPESTGDIEKWGKTASLFTQDKLSHAQKIIIESDDDKWNIDSTGDRYTLWIWYLPQGETEYRNLNIELLQYGYGRASSIADSRYEEIANNAIVQAQEEQLRVWSPADTKDVNFFEGDAANIDLRELRFHAEDYEQKTVRVEGTVVAVFSNTAYIEDYDDETGVSYGFAVYYGFKTGKISEILRTVGNRVSVYGTVTEFGETYQISGVSYDIMDKDAPTNTQLLSEKTEEVPFKLTEAKDIVEAGRTVKATYSVYDEELGESVEKPFEIDAREALMSTSVTVANLRVISMHTTETGGNSDGAISITCEATDGTRITVRTQKLYKADGKTLYTEADIQTLLDAGNGRITVKGIVDKFTLNGLSYQVAVHKFENIEFLTD